MITLAYAMGSAPGGAAAEAEIGDFIITMVDNFRDFLYSY